MFEIEKSLSNLMAVCSKDETRYNLNGIYFDSEGKQAVATNGTSMVVKSIAGNFPADKIAKLPKIGKSNGDFIEIDEKGINHVNPKESVSFVDGNYPIDSVRAILGDEMLKTAPAITLHLSADALQSLAKALCAPDVYPNKSGVTIEVWANDKPMRVTAYGQPENGTGILMPCKTPKA